MTDIEIATRLLTSLGAGALIGLEREFHGSGGAGLRTHMLVSLGSAVFMLVSIMMAESFPGSDPARIAAQVVTGIGFLGAGVILRSSASVRGLTTAASVWAIAGIGLAAGAGFYRTVLIAAFLMLVTLGVVRSIEKKLDENLKEKDKKKGSQ